MFLLLPVTHLVDPGFWVLSSSSSKNQSILKHPPGIPYECILLLIHTGLIVFRSVFTIQTPSTSWSLCTTAISQKLSGIPLFFHCVGSKSAFPSWSSTAKLIELEAKFKILTSSWDCQTYRTTKICSV